MSFNVSCICPKRSFWCGSAPEIQITKSGRNDSTAGGSDWRRASRNTAPATNLSKPHVQRAGHLAARVIGGDVDRVGENARVSAEEGVGAVALVRVGIHDHDPQFGPVGLEVAHGHRDIVEQTKPLPPVGERVVRAAGEVGRDAVRQRRPHGAAGALHLTGATDK